LPALMLLLLPKTARRQMADRLFRLEPRLTSRQRLVLDCVRDSGPDGVDPAEIGAYLHAQRTAAGHPAGERCNWCKQDGAAVLRSKALGQLVKRRRKDGRYVLRDPRESSQTNEVPY
jgi:hypothetical protein